MAVVRLLATRAFLPPRPRQLFRDLGLGNGGPPPGDTGRGPVNGGYVVDL